MKTIDPSHRPLVSVIMPAFKAEKYILEALISVKGQTYSNWEIIIVEDGSRDKTEEIVKKFSATAQGHRILFIRHEVNKGISAARNTAIYRSQGDYISLLDLDDVWGPTLLEKMVAVLAKHDPDLVYSTMLIFTDGLNEEPRPWGALSEDLENFPASLWEKNYITLGGALIKKSSLKKCGFFLEDKRAQGAEDYEVSMRMARSGCKFMHVGGTYYFARRHSGNMTNKIRKMREAGLFAVNKNRDWDIIPESKKSARIKKLCESLISIYKRDDWWRLLLFALNILVRQPFGGYYTRRMFLVKIYRSFTQRLDARKRSLLVRLQDKIFPASKVIFEYRRVFKRMPDLLSPGTFNEKIIRKMIFDRDDRLTIFADKFLARDFVRSKLNGDEHLPRLYAVLKDPAGIPLLNLPDKFVMKPNHLSNEIKIVYDSKKLHAGELEKIAAPWLRRNHYYYMGEWAYKNVKPCIMFEELLESKRGIPDDYKFFCFNGEPRFIQVDRDRFTCHKRNMYDLNLSLLPVRFTYENFHDKIDMPRNYEHMLDIARKLSSGIDFIRVDLYNIDGRIVFGELTNYHFAGLAKYEPDCWDSTFGSYWK